MVEASQTSSGSVKLFSSSVRADLRAWIVEARLQRRSMEAEVERLRALLDSPAYEIERAQIEPLCKEIERAYAWEHDTLVLCRLTQLFRDLSLTDIEHALELLRAEQDSARRIARELAGEKP